MQTISGIPIFIYNFGYIITISCHGHAFGVTPETARDLATQILQSVQDIETRESETDSEGRDLHP